MCVCVCVCVIYDCKFTQYVPENNFLPFERMSFVKCSQVITYECIVTDIPADCLCNEWSYRMYFTERKTSMQIIEI